MLSGLKAVVTGGFGFIGSHLTEGLLGRGFTVTAFNRDDANSANIEEIKVHPGASNLKVVVGEATSLEDVVRTVKGASVVFHLAALTSHRLSLSDPHAYLSENVTGTVNVLEAARRVEPTPKVVFASSSSVYGKQDCPWVETMTPKPEGPYALSKHFGEKLCGLYHEQYGIPMVILRYFNVVGERSRGNIVISVFAERLAKGLPPQVYGKQSGSDFVPASRDFTYVGDTVEGTILSAEKQEAVGEVINLGGGNAHSVLRVAELMVKEFGVEGRIQPVLEPLSAHESLTSFADGEKAKKVLGWTPKVSLEETVRRYCEWFKSRSAQGQVQA
ncbi:MAG: GDP-mannose 4,6-dehydratase [Candidatus Bathyarchaeia archaeon]